MHEPEGFASLPTTGEPGVLVAPDPAELGDLTATIQRLLPPVAQALAEAGCELRGDARARSLVPGMGEATTEDWGTEYLAPIMSVAVVDGVDGAAAHIAAHGSAHTDAIVAEDGIAAVNFEGAVTLCQLGAKFNRPADADKCFRNLTALSDSYLQQH